MKNPVKMICGIMGITPTQLAKKLEISTPSLYAWKKVPPASIPKVCNMTGLWPWEVCDEYDLEKMKIARDYKELDKRKEKKE